MTWNVLVPSLSERTSDALGLESGGKGRAARVNDWMKRTRPDVVALQEVTAGFLSVLLKDPHWSCFHVTTEAGVDPPGGLVLLSRFPIERAEVFKLPSPSGRYVLLGTIAVEGQVLQFGNVHLESPLEAGAQRLRQMAKVDSRLGRRKPAIWLGDFNFGDEDPESRSPLLSSWVDAWSSLYPANPGFTYDLEANRLAYDNAFPKEASRRLDRVLISKNLQPLGAGLVGQPEGGEPPPSDHYGLWVDVRLPKQEDPAGAVR